MKGITKELEELQSNLDSGDFRVRNVIKMIPDLSGRALDLGAGSGFITVSLSKKASEVYSVDYSKKLVDNLRKLTGNIKNIKVFHMNAESLKFSSGFFDIVVTTDALEHIENDVKVLSEIHRVLNNKGKLFVVVPAFQFLYGKRDKNGGHYRRYNKKELRMKISQAGFKIHKMRFWNMLGFFPYLFSEKILKKELGLNMRSNKEKGVVKKILNSLFDLWFRYIENNINLGFGLSLICIAEKKKIR